MSVLLNKMITIKNVQRLSWRKSSVYVSPRPYHALAFRAKGTAIFTHEDSTVTSLPETITYMPANYHYHAEYPDANEIYVIHFDSDTNLKLESYLIEPALSVFSLFKNAFEIWNSGKDAYYFKTMSIYFEILALIASRANTVHRGSSYNDFIIALEYMKNNFTNPELSIERLSEMANMSNTYFRKLFVERVGETPSRHLTTLRLHHAENLLLSGKYSIEDIAYLSGFNDAKYFSRTVKKIYGYPPSRLYKK